MSGKDKGLRVLLVHEWLLSRAGSEKVFEIFLQAFPDADVASLWINDDWRHRLADRRVYKLAPTPQPRGETSKAALAPFMPAIWQRLNGERYDLILSSQHAFAHTSGFFRRARYNLTYVHAPARYVWDPKVDVRGDSWKLRPIQAALRNVDRRLAGHHTSIAVNSTAVQRRVRDYWGRDSVVVYPPVDVQGIQARRGHTGPDAGYLVGAGRWVSYKRPDSVIRVGEALNRPVKLIGSGPMKAELEELARKARVPVQLLEGPSDAVFRRVLADASCLVSPGVEDFGITMVEAIAGGTPVLAAADGGAVDIIRPGVNGALVEDVDDDSAWRVAFNAVTDLPREACSASVSHLSTDEFERNFKSWVMGAVPETKDLWS